MRYLHIWLQHNSVYRIFVRILQFINRICCLRIHATQLSLIFLFVKFSINLKLCSLVSAFFFIWKQFICLNDDRKSFYQCKIYFRNKMKFKFMDVFFNYFHILNSKTNFIFLAEFWIFCFNYVTENFFSPHKLLINIIFFIWTELKLLFYFALLFFYLFP